MRKEHLAKTKTHTYCGILYIKDFYGSNVSCIEITNEKPLNYDFILRKRKCLKCHYNYMKKN